MRRWIALGPLLLAALPCPAPACSLCYNVRQTPTLRQGATEANARLVLFGTAANPRFQGSTPGAGVTEFRVSSVLKADPTLVPRERLQPGASLTLPLYLPVTDPKHPPTLLVFCNVAGGRCDPYRSVQVTSAAAADYLRGALALDPRDRRKALLYFFRFLDHADKGVAEDAYMEFVKATDAEIGAVGPHLSAAKLRAWLKDPALPAARLGLYAFLLGACGGKEDVAWFEAVLARPPDRAALAYDGVLGGYIQLRPREGWALAAKLFGEGRAPVVARFAAVRTLDFYHAWKPKETRPQVLQAMAAILKQGELADMAIGALLRWRMWDLTDAVLATYGRRGVDAPIQRRAIVTYALCCPLPKAKGFVEALRKTQPEMVNRIEDDLRGEQQ
jgi:hypothetical protein